MDYETSDGSQFSLREIWSENIDAPQFDGTLVTAFVDGDAYVGRSSHHMDELDDTDILQCLEPVPVENIFPVMPETFTVAPPFDAEKHYLKAPQFTYEDRASGNTFVADCLLSEAGILEQLKKHSHPSLVGYQGCVVRDKRITHLSLGRCPYSLPEYIRMDLSVTDRQRLLEQLDEGIKHLHSLGLAHNDITTDNVCIDEDGHAVLVDFDSCKAFGDPLTKGVSRTMRNDGPISDPENDFKGLKDISRFLLPDESNAYDQSSD